MNRALALPLGPALTLALLASPAAADPRLKEVMYDETKVVRIEGKPTVQASIMFGEDEVIENVAIGDSSAWQVTPNKRADILFVKPLATRATTNMTVVTSKRTYLFDLVASPGAKPLYVLRFDYPPEPKSEDTPQLALSPNAIEQQVIAEPEAVIDPADLNFAWAGEGDAELLPARTYDDGNSTYLSWPVGEPVPAILITNDEGVEGPVNFAVRGDVIVITGVPRQIVLRAGEDHATLINSGPERPASATSTSQPGGAALASATEID